MLTEYPVDTLLIDDYLGIEIQFDSLDNDLDEITFLEAQQNRLLVFVGNEILSAWNPQLVDTGSGRSGRGTRHQAGDAPGRCRSLGHAPG